MWEMRNVTPLERLPQFTSLVITAAEAEARDFQRVAQLGDPSRLDFLADGYDTLKIEPIHGKLHSSIIVDPEDGLLPGNELFRKQREERRDAILRGFDGPEQRPNSERCLQHIRTTPPILMGMDTSLHQIVQSPGIVIFMTEMMHEARVIRMNTNHVPAAVLSWLGDSIGWWEADTLVVETKHFAPSSQARALGQTIFFVSSQATIRERFTRVSNDELLYRFTVTDPTYYTRPWTGENSFRWSTERMYESACHEGNRSLGYALQGARVQEANAGNK
jgi:hypothetical protein